MDDTSQHSSPKHQNKLDCISVVLVILVLAVDYIRAILKHDGRYAAIHCDALLHSKAVRFQVVARCFSLSHDGVPAPFFQLFFQTCHLKIKY